MKGTFLSFDFVKNSEGAVKFLEMNTDTIATDSQISTFDYTDFFGVLSANSITRLDVIYKPELHHNIISHLSSSAASNGVTTFNKYEEGTFNNFPTVVEDGADRFILRLAYDDNAIVDYLYCRDTVNAYKILHEYQSGSHTVPFTYSSSIDDYDYIAMTSSAEYTFADNLPNVVRKHKTNVWEPVEFYKVTDFDALKEASYENYVLTTFCQHGDAIANNAVESIRHFAITYGTDLQNINVGTSLAYSTLQIPASIAGWDGTSNYAIPRKHYYEFSTNVPKSLDRREGVYTTEKFLNYSDDSVLSPSDISAGTVLKSYHIEGAPDSDIRTEYRLWRHEGKTLPAGSKVSGSVALGAPLQRDPIEQMLLEISMSGSSNPVYMSVDTAVVLYKSSSNDFAYRSANTIDKDDDYIADVNGNLVPLTGANYVVLNEQTGSIYSVDVEPLDHLVIDSDGVENVLAVPLVIHNAKSP